MKLGQKSRSECCTLLLQERVYLLEMAFNFVERIDRIEFQVSEWCVCVCSVSSSWEWGRSEKNSEQVRIGFLLKSLTECTSFSCTINCFFFFLKIILLISFFFLSCCSSGLKAILFACMDSITMQFVIWNLENVVILCCRNCIVHTECQFQKEIAISIF